jgi:hypothetical protein
MVGGERACCRDDASHVVSQWFLHHPRSLDDIASPIG